MLENNQTYRISFDYDGPADVIDEVYVDFYANPDYDSGAQQAPIVFKEGRTHYQYELNSGIIPETAGETTVRIVVNNVHHNAEIRDFTVEKIQYALIDNPYDPVLQEGNISIYENRNCKDLLYVPSEVKNLEESEAIYGQNGEFEFADVSYVKGFQSYAAADARVSNMMFDGNRICADVDASGHSFLNFSQAFYPGWRAYIDGQGTELREVNGYIQGIEIPSGRHHVEFRYVPFSLLAGGVVSVFTLLIWSICLLRQRKG